VGLPIKLDIFFSLWSFNFLFHFYSILDWLRNEIHGLFFLLSIELSQSQINIFILGLMQACSVIIKLNKHNLQKQQSY